MLLRGGAGEGFVGVSSEEDPLHLHRHPPEIALGSYDEHAFNTVFGYSVMKGSASWVANGASSGAAECESNSEGSSP